jgi:hypothetical protein
MQPVFCPVPTLIPAIKAGCRFLEERHLLTAIKASQLKRTRDMKVKEIYRYKN